MRFYIEFALVKILLFFMHFLPQKAIFSFCHFLASSIFKFDAKRRSITLRNLALAYPSMPEMERFSLAKRIYENVGISVAEIVLMLQRRIDLDSMMDDYDQTIQDMEHSLQDTSKGILFLTGHFGNWELLAHFFAKHGHSTLIIGRRGNNHLIEDRITTPFRKQYGNTLAYKDQAMSATIRALKHHGIVGMLIDQKAGGANCVKATFFGHPADTVNSVALLKLRYNPLIIPLFMARQPNGKYKLIIGSNTELLLPEALSQDEQITRLTQHYNNIIEEIVRKYPEQWFWMHDRWRLPK